MDARFGRSPSRPTAPAFWRPTLWSIRTSSRAFLQNIRRELSQRARSSVLSLKRPAIASSRCQNPARARRLIPTRKHLHTNYGDKVMTQRLTPFTLAPDGVAELV